MCSNFYYSCLQAPLPSTGIKMAAVVAAAAPLFVLALSAVFLSHDEGLRHDNVNIGYHSSADSLPSFATFREYQAQPEASSKHQDQSDHHCSHHTDTDRTLADVLRRFDVHSDAFVRHRALVEEFISEATTYLPRLSPLLTGVTTHHDGSSFEGTRIAEAADFDMYAVLTWDQILRHFELLRGAEGRIAARLRPDVNRDALPTDLARLVRDDGYLDALRFKRWVFDRLEEALRLTSKAHPDLGAGVYSTRGAAGVDLTAPDGARLEVDLTAQLAGPPMDGVIRPEAVTPCGLQLVSPDLPTPWSVYSNLKLTSSQSTSDTVANSDGISISTTSPSTTNHDENSAESNEDDEDDEDEDEDRWFIINSMKLERNLLSAKPKLRDVIRLLKSISAAHGWKARFHIDSFVLKHVAFWSFSEDCGSRTWSADGGLKSATVASLRTFERALRRGRMDKFFVGPPADSVFAFINGGRPAMELLANEVGDIVRVLTGEDQYAIKSLFRVM